MMMRHDSRRGMSLLEVMVASAILVLVGAIIYAVLSGGSKTYDATTRLTHIQEQGRRVVDEMAGELREADLSTLVVGANTVTFRKNTGFAGGVPTWGPNITYSMQASTVDANENGGGDDRLLQRAQAGSNPLTLTHYIAPNGLVFTLTGSNLLIRVTLRSADGSGKTITAFVESSVTLRNESAP